MRRLLVTTALEETWGEGVPVLFLGEWCRLYNRKHIWSEMDALVARPFGVEPAQKASDTDYVDGLAIKILSELSAALNKFHQVQHSERYWNIVLGHWLKRYVSVAFNRYHTLDQALKNYNIEGTIIFKDSGYTLTTPDSGSFMWACDDDRWNHTLYSRIIDYRGEIKRCKILRPQGWGEGYSFDRRDLRGEPLRAQELVKSLFSAIAFHGMGDVIYKLLGQIGTKFSRDTDAFFISSYLPPKIEVMLQLALGQIPQLWRCPTVGKVKSEPEKRTSLKLDCDSFKGFEKYVRWQLAEIIPVCYLEGYKNLVKITKELTWPKEPKLIFASNSFDTEEVFKVWTASKVEQGIPYIVGQHGNNYGTHAWHGTPSNPERAASDKFITWGWSERKHKTIPAFVFTKAGRNSKKNVKDGGLLLVESHLPFNFQTYDEYYEHLLYMEDQFRIVESLPNNIFRQVTVRLHGANKRLKFCEEQRWKDRSPQTKIERDGLNIKQSISQNRLIVYSYDSTGILEGLSLNIPTICFWRNGLIHLLPSAKPFYGLLHNVGILFYSPEAAAKFIDLHWDDISEWWKSEKVQDARQIFCDQYARTTDNPVQELKSILTGSL